MTVVRCVVVLVSYHNCLIACVHALTHNNPSLFGTTLAQDLWHGTLNFHPVVVACYLCQAGHCHANLGQCQAWSEAKGSRERQACLSAAHCFAKVKYVWQQFWSPVSGDKVPRLKKCARWGQIWNMIKYDMRMCELVQWPSWMWTWSTLFALKKNNKLLASCSALINQNPTAVGLCWISGSVIQRYMCMFC